MIRMLKIKLISPHNQIKSNQAAREGPITVHGNSLQWNSGLQGRGRVCIDTEGSGPWGGFHSEYINIYLYIL